MPSGTVLKLRNAFDAVAVGGFLIVWLTVWPVWLVMHRRLPVRRGA